MSHSADILPGSTDLSSHPRRAALIRFHPPLYHSMSIHHLTSCLGIVWFRGTDRQENFTKSYLNEQLLRVENQKPRFACHGKRQWQARGEIPWVFHRDSFPIGDIRKAWKTACRKAGVPGEAVSRSASYCRPEHAASRSSGTILLIPRILGTPLRASRNS